MSYVTNKVVLFDYIFDGENKPYAHKVRDDIVTCDIVAAGFSEGYANKFRDVITYDDVVVAGMEVYANSVRDDIVACDDIVAGVREAYTMYAVQYFVISDDVVAGGTQGTIRLFINNCVLIDIVHPEDRWLYVFGEKKFHLKYPGQKIVIGKITVVAEELEPLQKVEFYLDGKLVYTDNEYPYEWVWNRFSFGRHTVTAVAHDADGNYGGEDEITVWKLF